MCPDIVTWVGNEGRRHVSINCRNGKNCNHAHSREEILYHPTVYKTSMCESWNCSRYYCPFAHSMDELVSKPPPFDPHADPAQEEQRLRQLNLEDFWEDNDFEESLCGGPAGSPMSGPSDFDMSSSLQMRRVLHRTGGSGGLGGPLISTTSLESSRIGPSCLQSLANSASVGGGNPDPGWITLTQGLRLELIVRAISPLTGGELCLGTARAPWEAGAASANGNQNRRGQQQASMVVKIIPIDESDSELMSLMNQLQSVARSEHKNILAIKKVHLARLPDKSAALAIAYERCSTSLYTTIADGYRSRGIPRGLAGRMSPGRSFTATSAAVGKIGELLGALHRFHSMGMTHCRISPSNVFIDADANLKLGDFDSKYGLLRGFANEQFLAESVAVWTAPEVTDCLLAGGNIKQDIDWRRADIFAAGLCVFLALTGQHPFGTFADEDRLAAAGAAANCRSMAGQSLFVEGKDEVIENMRNLNFVNQHLLYGTPLLLDLVMRMLVNRSDVSDLLGHPLFWDFYALARFFTRLPADDSPEAVVIKTLGDSCPIPWTSAVLPEEWKHVLSPQTPMDFKDSVGDLVKAIRSVLHRHKSSGCGLCSSSADSETPAGHQHHFLVTTFVNRMAGKFPAVVVRAWDASRISAALTSVGRTAEIVNLKDVFLRNHLSWTNSRPRLLAQPDGRSVMLPSHTFVREYYRVCGSILDDPKLSFDKLKKQNLASDESAEILASIVALAASASSQPSPSVRPVDPAILSSMLNSFGSMMRSDMLPPNVPKSFVISLIEAAGSVTGAPTPVLTPSPSPSAGVYYSTVLKPQPSPSLQLPSGATTAASSPAFVPLSLGPMAIGSPKKGSPLHGEAKDRRGSSCDGWEYAVACPPTMTSLQPRVSALSMHNADDEDNSPPPGFQTVWQSMADDGL
jgi:serine/threonine protein kinase